MTITVYSTPTCVQCTATYRSLNSNKLDYDVIDLTADAEALVYVREQLGYNQAPVVVAPDGTHWSGFRPDLIAQLATTRAAAGDSSVR